MVFIANDLLITYFTKSGFAFNVQWENDDHAENCNFVFAFEPWNPGLYLSTFKKVCFPLHFSNKVQV